MASTTRPVSNVRIAMADPSTELTPVHWTALSLAAVTGFIHLYLYTTEDWLPFLIAGAGFVGAIGLFFALRSFRRPIYVAGVLFTLAQIAGYVLFPMGPVWIGVLDKAVQVALIVALGYLFFSSGSRSPVEVTERAMRA